MREREIKVKAYDELVAQLKDAEPTTKAIEVHDEPVFKVTEKPAVIYKAPEIRKAKHNPVRKAKEMINRGSKIVSLFRAI